MGFCIKLPSESCVALNIFNHNYWPPSPIFLVNLVTKLSEQSCGFLLSHFVLTPIPHFLVIMHLELILFAFRILCLTGVVEVHVCYAPQCVNEYCVKVGGKFN